MSVNNETHLLRFVDQGNANDRMNPVELTIKQSRRRSTRKGFLLCLIASIISCCCFDYSEAHGSRLRGVGFSSRRLAQDRAQNKQVLVQQNDKQRQGNDRNDKNNDKDNDKNDDDEDEDKDDEDKDRDDEDEDKDDEAAQVPTIAPATEATLSPTELDDVVTPPVIIPAPAVPSSSPVVPSTSSPTVAGWPTLPATLTPTVSQAPAPTQGETGTSMPTPTATTTDSTLISPPPTTTFRTMSPTSKQNALAEAELDVLFSLYRDTPLSAAEISSGNATELTGSISDAVLFVMCAATDFVVVKGRDVFGEEFCTSLRSITEDDSKSIISDATAMEVSFQRNDNDVQWTEWRVTLKVLRIGKKYLLAQEQQEDLFDRKDDDMSFAIELMRKSAQNAIDITIEEETFDDLIEHNVKSSIAGQEAETFSPAGSQIEVQPAEPLDPAPFHALRVVGIALFILNLVSGFILMKLAGRRQRMKERNRKLEDFHGGLNTEEGVNLMLTRGRGEDSTQEGEGNFGTVVLPEAKQTPPSSPASSHSSKVSVPLSPLTPGSVKSNGTPTSTTRKTPGSSSSRTHKSSHKRSPRSPSSRKQPITQLNLPSLLGPRDEEDASQADCSDNSAMESGMFTQLLPEWLFSPQEAAATTTEDADGENDEPLASPISEWLFSSSSQDSAGENDEPLAAPIAQGQDELVQSNSQEESCSSASTKRASNTEEAAKNESDT